MTATASTLRLRDLVRPTHTDLDKTASPSDGLVVFSATWAFAMLLSVAAKTTSLTGGNGLATAAIYWVMVATCIALIARPRQTWLLGLLAGVFALQYAHLSPVYSNNKTIAFFMNCAILVVVGIEIIKTRSLRVDRHLAYERLRIVARALLAVMYFYGIFHKINWDFLDPRVSCAVALYEPITRHIGLDQNLVGRYGAIAATFVVEAITLVSLYWRRFFWVGLILGLAFHYIIPISAFSWYMDFSSLVLALYMLSTPREVSAGFYATTVGLLRRTSLKTTGHSALAVIAGSLAVAGVVVLLVAQYYRDRELALLWHSAWLIVWAVVGGIAMVLITRAALLALPYRSFNEPRQPLWLYLFPAVLFVSCLSPYVGLKTESSIAMFSNLHTEGGETNHLLFETPPYLFPYQKQTAHLLDTSNPGLRAYMAKGQDMVLFELGEWLRHNPRDWVSYQSDGVRFERVTAATFSGPPPTWLERKFLGFKPVVYSRPKACTH